MHREKNVHKLSLIYALIICCTADEFNADYDGSADADKRFLTMLHLGT